MVLCGCNEIFGLSGVTEQHVDAQYFDRILDARPTCPTGGAVPTFRPDQHPIPGNLTCIDGSVATRMDRQEMTALRLSGSYVPHFGTVMDGPAPMVFDPPISGYSFASIRLAPDGTFALALVYNANVSAQQIIFMARNPGADTWTIEGDSGIAVVPSVRLSTPTSPIGGSRHLLVIGMVAGETVLEYTGDHTTWMLQDSYPVTDTGLAGIQSSSLTDDGLRLVVRGNVPTAVGVYYFVRDDPTQRFSGAQEVATLPDMALDPFMTSDCGQMFFDISNAEQYVYQ